MLVTALGRAGYHVEAAADGQKAAELLRKRPFHLIVSDLRLPHVSGIELLKIQKDVDANVPVLIMTAYGTIEEAVEAMKQGAFDFIAKPVDISHLLLLVERALAQRSLVLENALLKEEFQSAYGIPTIIGESAAIKEVGREIQQVAPTEATVLLTGESGTGKEVFSRAVHQLSKRKDKPFVTVNCAAIPSNLIENELFGHEKGAYTGAFGRKIGKFEHADKGTIFLDEIGELDIGVQAKVLRVVEEQIFERIGGLDSLHVDTRIIAATNRDLQNMVEEKRFREDLFFRLSVFPIPIPPLRSRPRDIPLLARFFVDKFCVQLHRSRLELAPAAIEAMEAYDWPGNVRELQNTIERAVILAEGAELGADSLHFAFRRKRGGKRGADGLDLTGTLSDVVARVSRAAESAKIRQALERVGWNKTRAAEELGVSYKTLLNKVKDYGLNDSGQ